MSLETRVMAPALRIESTYLRQALPSPRPRSGLALEQSGTTSLSRLVIMHLERIMARLRSRMGGKAVFNAANT